MCYNCGCGIPDDDMGSPDNITNKTFERVAAMWKVNSDAAKDKVLNMLNGAEPENDDTKMMFSKASNAWGQSEEEARSETKKLLEKAKDKKN
jgi:hypothetical protein